MRSSGLLLLLVLFFASATVDAIARQPKRLDDATCRLDTTEYSHSFAVKMLPVASAAYSDTPLTCMQSLYGALPEDTFTAKFKCPLAIENVDCMGFVTYAQNAIIIGFRGSETTLQAIQEGVESYLELSPTDIGGATSLYFQTVFEDAWYGTRNDQNAGLTFYYYKLQQKYPNAKTIVVGHSLGGAAAAIAAATIVFLKKSLSSDTYLFTYGQPRTGDLAWTSLVEQLGMHRYRVVNYRDPIPHAISEMRGYQHFGYEAWYNDPTGNMAPDTLTVCTTGECALCSDKFSILDPNINLHLFYFGLNVSGFGIDGCPKDALPKVIADALMADIPFPQPKSAVVNN